jgi:hypothetical protein
MGRDLAENEKYATTPQKIKGEKKRLRFVPFYQRSQRQMTKDGSSSRDVTAAADGKVITTGSHGRQLK